MEKTRKIVLTKKKQKKAKKIEELTHVVEDLGKKKNKKVSVNSSYIIILV